MGLKAFEAIAHIGELNELKQGILHGKAPISERDFRAGLKSCGIPSNIVFWSEFKNSGLIVKVEGNMFVWKNRQPIHHKMLQSIYSRYQDRMNMYAKTYKGKQEELRVAKDKEIDNAINLLKSEGFVILTPHKGLYKKL